MTSATTAHNMMNAVHVTLRLNKRACVMKRPTPLLSAALIWIPLACAAAPAAAEAPPVFADLGYNEAIERSIEQDRLLLVDGTAVWCGPCQRMDETTWIDPDVVSWIEENAIAIQVDVDEQPDVARGLRIRAMPTMVAFSGGEEVDRIAGYRNGADTLEWLENVAAGKTRRAALLEKARGGPMDMMERMDLARQLVDAGEYANATEEYAWLWENMLDFDPAMVGVRGSFMLSEIESLTRVHEPAKERFEQIRKDIERRLRSGEAQMSDLRDWAQLSDALGRGNEIVAWYDRIKDAEGAAQSIRMVERQLVDALLERNRYADAGRAITSPLAEAQRAVAAVRMTLSESMRDLPESAREQAMRAQHEWTAEVVGRNYGLCLAAGRDEEAKRIRDLVRGLEWAEQGRLEMVEWALRVGEPRRAHMKWLAGAEWDRAASLRNDLEQALSETGEEK